jgi:long-chain-fatty-acid--CoA ligase ACSBG
MNKRTYDYFTSLDIPIVSIYGMTETSGAATTWSQSQAKMFTCGVPLKGTQMKLHNPDDDGTGEICMKGRNMFMGYFKNEKATLDIYDKEGFVHSGDLGSLKDGFVTITGRIKELIITAGGENVAPILIEDIFKQECGYCSQIMVVGDDRKFLTALITLKVNVDMKTGIPSNQLTNDTKIALKN